MTTKKRAQRAQHIAWKLADKRNTKRAPKPSSRWESKASGQRVHVRSVQGAAPWGMDVFFTLDPQGSSGFMSLDELLRLYRKRK